MGYDTVARKQLMVAFLIRSCLKENESFEFSPIPMNCPFDDDPGRDELGDSCVVTGMYFDPDMSENNITITSYGPVWMGLWLGEKIKFDKNGSAIFPRWLGQIINDTIGLGIKTTDMY